MADEDITFEGTGGQAHPVSSYTARLNATNAALTFRSIHGKDYAEVNQRVLAFWSLFPNGCIVTRKLNDDGNRCDVEAAVYRDAQDDRPAATGHAYEVRKGNINSTSYVENCETSAVGRALGFLGIGATSSIASAEEVQAAMEAQGTAQQKQPPIQGPVHARCRACGKQHEFASAEEYQSWANYWAQGGSEGARARCCPSPTLEVI